MVSLDVKDRKLLYHLSLDARLPDTRLAKLVGLSPNAVKYRKERLVEEGIVTRHAALVDLGSLGLETFTLLLRFNQALDDEMLAKVMRHPYLDWAIRLSGHWDLFTEFVCYDQRHLVAIVDELICLFAGALERYEVNVASEILRVEHLVADLMTGISLELPAQKERVRSRQRIDATDGKLLRLLSEDGAMPLTKLAERLTIPVDTARYRLKGLLSKGILIRCFAEISLDSVGYTEYLCTLTLMNPVPEQLVSLKNLLRHEPNITYAFFDLAGRKLFFLCACKSTDELDALLASLRSAYRGMVEMLDYLLVTKQLLFDLYPAGLLEEQRHLLRD